MVGTTASPHVQRFASSERRESSLEDEATGKCLASCGIIAYARMENHTMPDLPGSHLEPPIVPKRYGGKWIAWDYAGTKIVASGDTLAAAKQAAEIAGEVNPRFEKVPHSDVRIIGAAR